MTDEKNCCSLPLYDSPDVCSSCRAVDGVTIIQGKKGTGMGLFSAWLAYKMRKHFGKRCVGGTRKNG